MLFTFMDSAASHTVSSGPIEIRGEDITSSSEEVKDFSFAAILLTKSLSVRIPTGEFCWFTIMHPIFFSSINFAASLIIEEESNEAMLVIITSLTNV